MPKTFSNKEEVIVHIHTILTDLFELSESELSPEKNLFTDLGLDSLDAIDMIVKFKKEFGIKPPNEELMQIRLVSDVYQLVDKYYEKNS